MDAPEICLSLAADLLEAYNLGTGLSYGPVNYSAAQIKTILDTYQLYVLPTANPDGFNFSKANDLIGGFAGLARATATPPRAAAIRTASAST